MCKYTGSAAKVRSDPVGVVTDITLKTLEVNATLNEFNWGVCLRNVVQDGSTPVVLNGLVWANVTILQTYHKHVNARNDILESANHGKGTILVANPAGPSLICIGPRQKLSGVALTDAVIPGGNETAPGEGTGVILEIDAAKQYVNTGISIALFNTNSLPTTIGRVQFKEDGTGRYLVDVSPCAS